MVHIIEIREHKDYNPSILDDLNKLVFDSKEELVEVLIKLGLPDTLWMVRVYRLEDFLDMINIGDSFDAVAWVDLNFLLDSDRLIEF